MAYILQWFIFISCFEYCWTEDDGKLPDLLNPSVWPLSNTTLGYEVLFDEPSGILHGREFLTLSLEPTQKAFFLNGETFVDIDFQTSTSGSWSFIAFIYLFNTSSGELYHYFDTANNTIFRAWLANGRFDVKFHPNLPAMTTEVLPTKIWFQLAIVHEDDDLLVYLNGLMHQRKNYFPDRYELPPGVFRIGRGFTGSFNGISAGLWCFRVYKDFVPLSRMDEARDQCWDRNIWTYKGPYGCMSEPCLNEATCDDTHLSTFTCNCTSGYKGQNCQTDIDDCEHVNCLNRGTCLDGIDSYTCWCGEDFTGEQCETLIEQDFDQGYFILIAREYKPDDSSSMAFMTSLNTRDCGKLCVQTPGCRSFATDAIQGSKLQCTLYSDILTARNFSNSSKYYIPKY